MSPRSFAKPSILLLLTALVVGWTVEASARGPGDDAVDLVLAALDAPDAGDAGDPEAATNAPSCTVGLTQAPPEGERLCVYFNDATSVPENPRNGWTYSRARNVVTFHGASCDGIQSGRVTDVDIVCGCDRR